MKHITFLTILAISLAGCAHGPESNKEAVEIHEEHKVQYAAYSSDFELFAEADPFVVGQESNVLSHFTHLPDFTALQKGSITLALTVDNEQAMVTLDQPTRKGIYSFDIKPLKAGVGRLEYTISSDLGLAKVLVGNIMVYTSEQEADEAAELAEQTAPPKTNTIVFTKEQSWRIQFSTDLPKREPFGQVIKTAAQVQSSQGDEVLVTAKTNGVVTFKGTVVTEGSAIPAGVALFSILGSGLADNNSSVRFAEATNNYEKSKSDYERAKDLAKDKIVSEKDLLQVKTVFENARAVYENLKLNFNASGQTVTSPMTGFVKQLFVKNGQYVEAGQPIVMISQNKTLVIYAEVQQKFAPYLASISSATLRTLNDSKTYSLEELNGKVLSYGRATTKGNFMIPLSLQIDNIGGFIPGGFIELYVNTLSNTQAITIPNTALLEEQGNYYVLVQVNPELFEKREIRIAASDGRKTEVVQGLSDQERIVTSGAVIIKLAQASGTLDAHSGHVH